MDLDLAGDFLLTVEADSFVGADGRLRVERATVDRRFRTMEKQLTGTLRRLARRRPVRPVGTIADRAARVSACTRPCRSGPLPASHHRGPLASGAIIEKAGLQSFAGSVDVVYPSGTEAKAIGPALENLHEVFNEVVEGLNERGESA